VRFPGRSRGEAPRKRIREPEAPEKNEGLRGGRDRDIRREDLNSDHVHVAGETQPEEEERRSLAAGERFWNPGSKTARKLNTRRTCAPRMRIRVSLSPF